jgi:ankyrin repeat protein
MLSLKHFFIPASFFILLLTPLYPGDIHKAAADGDLEGVKKLLLKDPRLINALDDVGRTPLLLAVLSQKEEVFKFLTTQGADVNLADKVGMSPLLFVSYMGLADWADLLIGKGAEINSQAHVLRFTPLHLAARAEKKDCAALLIAKGAKLDLRDRDGNTPLLTAAWYGRGEVVRLLLDKGALPDEKDAFGSTSLHLAALNGFKDIVEFLISEGADPAVKNERNGTPVSIAKREGHMEIVEILLAAGAKDGSDKAPRLAGEYLGQKKPGLTPELFAPGIISTEKKELNSVFTPDGKEFYFTIHTAKGPWEIMVMKLIDNCWTKPEPASFSGRFSDVDLFISPDGRKLFYCSNRPLDGKGEPKQDFDIWVVDRSGDGWSEPYNPGAPINSDEAEFYPSITRDGTLYFQSIRPDTRGSRDLYRAKLENGVYTRAENLGDVVNTNLFEGDILVSPDEEYIIFSVNRKDSFGLGDLYISFRQKDDAWTEPRNMGPEINTEHNENCPILTPDGRYLFFTRHGDIFWVDAKIIEQLKPQGLK